MQQYTRTASPAGGFTLVEVLVAVGVIALALPALLLVLRERADSTAYLRDQTFANWVAANRLAELRVARASGEDWTATANKGESELAGRRWRWSQELQPTGIDGFLRIDISVGEEDADTDIWVLSAFMRREGPALTGAEPPDG